mmetsp:Transcript_24738/g.74327  ORF Transcript_24738/g.74327 Transcript_24738/m.74327 type:complete len:103 (+) Transcript_24738:2098-2406(+)
MISAEDCSVSYMVSSRLVRTELLVGVSEAVASVFGAVASVPLLVFGCENARVTAVGFPGENIASLSSMCAFPWTVCSSEGAGKSPGKNGWVVLNQAVGQFGS